MTGHDDNKKIGWKKYKALVSNEAQLLRGAENYKTVHIKGRRRVADRASKPPGRGKRMSGRQILDIHEGKARVRPKHHQPVPNQYRI